MLLILRSVDYGGVGYHSNCLRVVLLGSVHLCSQLFMYSKTKAVCYEEPVARPLWLHLFLTLWAFL